MDNYYHKYIKYKSKYLHIKGGKRKKQSPSISATNFKIGTVQTGNDGNEWIVTKDKRGVRKWKVYKRIKRQNIGKITFDNYISITFKNVNNHTEITIDEIDYKVNNLELHINGEYYIKIIRWNHKIISLDGQEHEELLPDEPAVEPSYTFIIDRDLRGANVWVKGLVTPIVNREIPQSSVIPDVEINKQLNNIKF